jgi:hypothetical protein
MSTMWIRSAITIPALVLFAIPAIAASTPQQLIETLAQSAHRGNVEEFFANTTEASRHALADAQAAGTKMAEAKQRYLDALDARFGKAYRSKNPAPGGLSTPLSRIVKLELVSVQPKGPNQALLEVKTDSTTGRGQVISRTNTFTAVKEGGQWRLDLTPWIKEGIRSAAARTSAYEGIIRQVLAGEFKDRLSAVMASAKAQTQAGRAVRG